MGDCGRSPASGSIGCTVAIVTRLCCYGNHYVIAHPNKRVNIGSGLQSNGSQLVLKGEKTLSHEVSGLPVSEQFTENHEGNDLVFLYTCSSFMSSTLFPFSAACSWAW